MRLPNIKVFNRLVFKLIKLFCEYKKKIFTILAAVLATTFLTGLIYQYRIESTSPPENVRISNVTDQSLTISWTTKNPCFGFVFYSQAKLPFVLLTRIPFLTSSLVAYLRFPYPKIAADDHLAFTTPHHVTLKNLKPETSYYYLISTGLHLYRQQMTSSIEKNKTQALPNIKTGPILTELTQPEPVYGKVILEKDLKTPVVNALVYLQTDQSGLISTVTNNNGKYVLDLGNLRTADLNQPLSFFDQKTELNIFVNAGRLGAGQIAVDPSLSKPIPKILVK